MLNREELLKTHNDLTAKAREIMTAKNQDYATDKDVFRNLRLFGGLGILVRMSDKLARLRSFEENKEFAVADEKLSDTIQDLINYAVLYYAFKNEVKPTVEVKPWPRCSCLYYNLAKTVVLGNSFPEPVR